MTDENTTEVLSLSAPEADARRTVPSRRALAEALGCSERTVMNMRIEPGNPGTEPNGSYSLQRWREFYAERSRRLAAAAAGENAASRGNAPFALCDGDPDARRALREAMLRERRAKAELAELNAAARRGNLIELADAKKAATDFAAKVRAVHFRAATVEAPNELADLLDLDRAGLADLIQYMEKFHDEFCRRVAEGLLEAQRASDPKEADR